jgi:amino acid adenylation domain-containing protein
MTAARLLAELEACDIRLSVAEGKLRFSAPKGALTDELKARLAEEKAGIIALLEERAARVDAPIPLQPRGRGLPLSAAQQRFWFLDRLDSGNSAAFVMPPVVLQLSGPIDAGALQRALQALVERHEVLRSAFRIEDDQPVQVPLADVAVALPLHDLTALDADAREAQMQETIRQQALTPFDLQRGEVLLRAVLLRLAAREHVFVLTMHHIIADGWSMGILVDELARLYRAALRCVPAKLADLSEPAGLAPLPIQYADYAAWERTHLAGDHLARLTEHWRGVLGDAPDFLELPTDHPRPRVRGNRGQVVHFACDAAFTMRFNALCATAGVTPYMALLACFGLLLCRYTDKEDLVVGTPISVRPHEQVAPLIGLFLNTVALRLDLTGNPDGNELLRRVRRTALAAYEHAEMPFEQLLQTLDIPRSLDHTPLFQVLFALQNAPLGEVALEGLQIAPRPTESLHSPFDLVLSMEETAQGLTAFFRYNTDLFERPTVERMAGHFRRLLDGLVATPDVPVRELPMLDAAERRQLQDWRGGAAQFPVSGTLTQRFAAQAARAPAAVALRYADDSLSYGELAARANRVAQRLRRLGVKRGDRVGLCAERSLELVVGLLGILKAGAAYVPLDPTYPPERLGFMAEDAGLAVLVCFGAVPQEATPDAQRLDLADPTLADEPAESPDEGMAGDIAYVIYTSGSTGRPKGVEVTHANVLRLFDCSQALFGYGAGDVWSLFHSYAFDFSVWELWGALLYGGEVVVVPYAVSRSPDQFLRLLGDSGVTMLSQTPSAFRQLIEADCRAPEQIPLALKWVVFGGEALDPRSLARWVERRGLDAPQLINMYGITETTVHVSFHRLCAADIAQGGSVIGSALPDLSIDLVDSRGQPVPVGVPGEIWVGGAGVARGYLNRPELTAQRFVGIDGNRRYRSGDLARWRADGLLDYLGRMDLQVKIRGFRIELGEIEAALASHPAVAEAVVEAKQEGNGARLFAWVATAEWQDAELPARLREHLRTRLPDYMLPASLVALERLPLTGNGKLDRKALAALTAEQETRKVDAGETPRNALERLLADLWTEVLGRPVAGIDSNFFELGGDSIRAAILVNKIQDRLRSVVYVVALFEAPTIRALADYLRVHYPEALGRIEGEQVGQGGDALPAVEEKDVTAFAALIPPLPRLNAAGRKKNPRAIFVLSPPRSGSTLLRVLLGGHPALFSPPELELLGFETLGERARVCSGRDAFWREGTLRAAMEALGLDADAAQALMAEREASDMSVADFYAELQGWLGPRLLVDKSPSYALDSATLQRAEDYFEEPLYLHLHRHPYGMIASFEEAKLDQIFFRHPHTYPTRRLAELIWLHSHRNIAAFLAGIPPERQLAVGFAEMTHAPAETARRLCDFIGIDYLPEMLDIHGGGRMTDGPRAESRMLGDVKFHSHKGIDPAAADRWREIYDRDFLGAPAWAEAEKLGYTRDPGWLPVVAADTTDSAAPIRPVPRGAAADLPASFAQQRLWFLDQLEGAGAAYHMPVALRLSGALDAPALAASLAAVVRRHEVLRSRFETVDGAPVLRADVDVPAMDMADLRDLPAAERAAELERRIHDHAVAPFDLARGPLFRAALLRLDAAEWVALLNMHHIVSDGWSMGVLAREWSALYNAAAHAQADPLPPLPIQYADYAAWQREHLSVTRQIDYWRQQLAGAPALLELPTDRPRPAVQRFAGDTLTVHYDAALGRRLKQLADQSGVSLYMLLLAAYAVLLMRHSGQRDIVVGSPTANRARSEVEPLIGFFVNTLMLRLPLAADQSFADFLAEVRRRALEAYAHQDVPFEQLVEELRPQRNLSYAPLFQVMFSLQNTPPVAPELAGVEVEEIAVRQGMAKFDLTLSVTERAGALEAAFEYGTDLFDRATIERLAGHYRTLLEGIVAAPERSVDRLPLLPVEECRRMVDAWNCTQQQFDPPYSIVGLFEAQAQRTPEAVAVVFGERRLSYAALDALAESYAARLRAAGLATNQLAGVCLRRAPEMLAALLAVHKCGCAYVPIDPAYPAERIRHVLDDAGTALLLTQGELLPTLPECACPVLCIDTTETRKVDAGDTPNRNIHADLAYVIYTSGSTGKPKGVMVGQRAAANFLRSMVQAPGIAPNDRVLAVTTISFDIAVLELYLPLTVGACVVLADEATTRDGEALMALMQREAVTLAQATPATWRMLLEVGWAGDPRLTILCGGEAFPADLARSLLDRCGAVWNMYGPTETTVWSTVQHIDEEALRHASVSIGRPIANTTIRILDAHGVPQPAGVTGELLIGGDGLAAGYLGRPDLTAERFVPDPLAPGKLLYRTGDLARYLADGCIEYLGRGDQQVKMRGFRVELSEIEHVLGRQPGIAVCAVALDDASARLVAYYCGTRPESEDAELRRALGVVLPDYMVPSLFVKLDALPLTPNGKIDRNALHLPEGRSATAGEAVHGFRDGIEQALVRIWEEVLAVRPVGIRDNFFELGGHSIIAVRLMARVAQEFGRKLPLASLFQGATVEAMARLLREESAAPRWSALVPIRPDGEKPVFYCAAGAGGNVVYFHDLARALAPGRPFDGLQPPGLDGATPPLPTVEALAAHYLDTIRATGDTPRIVGGHSFGGLVAFDMARQLAAASAAPTLLILIDTPAPHFFHPTGQDWSEAEWLWQVAQIAEHLYGVALGLERAELDAEAGAGLELLTRRMIAADVLPPGTGPDYLRGFIGVYRANLQAVYAPPPLATAIRVLLLRSREAQPASLVAEQFAAMRETREMGWRNYLRGELIVADVPGDHLTMMRPPHVATLASIIEKHLEDAS